MFILRITLFPLEAGTEITVAVIVRIGYNLFDNNFRVYHDNLERMFA